MRLATVIIIGLLLTSCVSVKLAQQEAKRASGVKYAEPGKPFQADNLKSVDARWLNEKNGNTISYVTDCGDDNDPSLDSIIQGALGGITELKYEKKDSPTIQGREARRVLVSGDVDGVQTKIDMLTFKRDNCIYILNYVGVQKSFNEDHAAFDKFVQGFHAP